MRRRVMRDWSLNIQKDEGWTVRLYDDVSLAKEAVGFVWDSLCILTQGWIGGHGLPEVFWKIPVGKPQWDDEYEIYDNSIAALLYRFENWLYMKIDHDDEVIKLHVTSDTARHLDPDFVSIFEGDDESVGS